MTFVGHSPRQMANDNGVSDRGADASGSLSEPPVNPGSAGSGSPHDHPVGIVVTRGDRCRTVKALHRGAGSYSCRELCREVDDQPHPLLASGGGVTTRRNRHRSPSENRSAVQNASAISSLKMVPLQGEADRADRSAATIRPLVSAAQMLEVAKKKAKLSSERCPSVSVIPRATVPHGRSLHHCPAHVSP